MFKPLWSHSDHSLQKEIFFYRLWSDKPEIIISTKM